MQDGKHFRLARHPVMAQKLHDHLGKITPVDLLCKLRRVTLLSIPQCLHNKRTYNVNYVTICTGIIKHIHIVIKTTPEAISILISYLCHIVCKACSVTTITVCTLIHNNNIMYNNIDCKSDIWLTGNAWTMISGTQVWSNFGVLYLWSDHPPSTISKIMRTTSGFVFVITFLWVIPMP